MDYTKKIMYQSNTWYNDGLRKAQVRDMSGAIISLQQSLQYNRENIAARNLLGLVYYGIGEVSEALVEWIISKNLCPRDNIADYYIKNVQNSANELESLNQAIKKFNQCLVYCQQNGEDLAIIQLKQVIASHPTFLKAYQLLALIYIQTNQNTKARQILIEAKKLDTTNELTLTYLQEVTKQRGRYGKNAERSFRKPKSAAVEYSLGNETIIQPKRSKIRDMAQQLAFANILIGMVLGAALIWFLIAPAVNQNRSEKLNDQMRAYSEQINTLEAQVSAQTRTLDQYRTAGDEAQKAVDQAKATSDSYEKLLQVSSQSRSGEYSYTDMADALLEITRDSLGDSGKEMYDTLSDSIFPTACRRRYAAGVDSLESEDYDQAIEYLTKVVKMDESYNNGQAIYRLAQAYQGKGDTENAKTWYQKITDTFPGTQNASDAQDYLDALTGGSSSSTSSQSSQTQSQADTSDNSDDTNYNEEDTSEEDNSNYNNYDEESTSNDDNEEDYSNSDEEDNNDSDYSEDDSEE